VTNYPRSAYGSSNPNAGYPANGDRAAWGGYAWPGGVPTGLLAQTTYTSTYGQRLHVLMRRELVPLWNLAFELIDRKHRYCVYAVKNGEVWGPWGYSNRAVSGTNTASGHSMGLSVDMNAPNNPYSTSFASDMPPAMVADLESLGLYWGGRYTGKADAMHYGFCRAPGTLPQYISRARSLLGSSPTPPPADKDWFDMASEADLKKVVDAAIKAATPAIVDAVWAEKISYAKQTNDPKDPEKNSTEAASKVLSAAASYSGRAAKK